MDREIKSWLFDTNKAIDEIESFLPPGQRLFENYKNDLKTKRAIERNLEIIGEAIKRILEKDSSIEISHSRKIICSMLRSYAIACSIPDFRSLDNAVGCQVQCILTDPS